MQSVIFRAYSTVMDQVHVFSSKQSTWWDSIAIVDNTNIRLSHWCLKVGVYECVTAV